VKKYLVLFGALLVLGMPATQADAAGTRYISFLGGFSSINPFDLVNHTTGINDGGISTRSGLDLAIAVGKRIDDYKIEVEVGHLRNNANQGHFSVTSYMANGYYGCMNNGVEPYVTAGIGLAEIGVKNVNLPPVINDNAHPAFAFQFGAGVAVSVAKNIAIDLRYRYFGSNKVTLSNNDDIRITSHNYLVGLRFDF